MIDKSHPRKYLNEALGLDQAKTDFGGEISNVRKYGSLLGKFQFGLLGVLSLLQKGQNKTSIWFTLGIEFMNLLQLLSFTFNTSAGFPWSDWVEEKFVPILEASNLSFISSTTSSFTLTMFMGSFAFVTCTFGVVGYVGYAFATEGVKQLWLLGPLRIALDLLTTVLYVPALDSLLQIFQCTTKLSESITCGATIHIILSTVVAVLIIIFMTISGMAVLVIIERNPASGDLGAKVHGRLHALSLALRGLMSFTFVAIGSDNPIILAVQIVLSALLLAVGYHYYLPFYHMTLNKISMAVYGTFFFSTLCLVIEMLAYTDDQERFGAFMAFAVGAPLCFFVCDSLIEMRIRRLKHIQLSVVDSPMIGELIVRLHHPLPHTPWEKSRGAYLALVETHFPKSAYIAIQVATVLRECGNDTLRSERYMQKCKSLDLHFDERFVIFKHQLDQETARNTGVEGGGAINFMAFDNHINQAQQTVLQAMDNIVSVLRHLKSGSHNRESLLRLAHKLRRASDNANFHLEQLMRITNDSPIVFRLYSMYLEFVINDKFMAGALMDQAIALEEEADRADGIGITNVKNTIHGTMTLSGEEASLGIIRAVSPNLCKMLGYNNVDELVGQSINKIVPYPYDRMHDAFLARHLNMTTEFLQRRIEVWSLHSAGYAIATHLEVTSEIDQQSGEVVFHGQLFRKRVEKQDFFCIDRNTLNILFASKGAYTKVFQVPVPDRHEHMGSLKMYMENGDTEKVSFKHLVSSDSEGTMKINGINYTVESKIIHKEVPAYKDKPEMKIDIALFTIDMELALAPPGDDSSVAYSTDALPRKFSLLENIRQQNQALSPIEAAPSDDEKSPAPPIVVDNSPRTGDSNYATGKVLTQVHNELRTPAEDEIDDISQGRSFNDADIVANASLDNASTKNDTNKQPSKDSDELSQDYDIEDEAESILIPHRNVGNLQTSFRSASRKLPRFGTLGRKRYLEANSNVSGEAAVAPLSYRSVGAEGQPQLVRSGPQTQISKGKRPSMDDFADALALDEEHDHEDETHSLGSSEMNSTVGRKRSVYERVQRGMARKGKQVHQYRRLTILAASICFALTVMEWFLRKSAYANGKEAITQVSNSVKRSYYLIDLAVMVNGLNHGIKYNISESSASAFLEYLRNDSTELLALHLSVTESSVNDGYEQLTELNSEPTIKVFEDARSGFSYTSLWLAVHQVITSVYAILESIDDDFSSYTCDSACQYVLNNAAVETFEGSNLASGYYANIAASELESIRDYEWSNVIATGTAFLLFTIFVTVPTIREAYVSYETSCKTLFKVPRRSLKRVFTEAQERCTTVRERLREEFDYDFDDGEESHDDQPIPPGAQSIAERSVAEEIEIMKQSNREKFGRQGSDKSFLEDSEPSHKRGSRVTFSPKREVRVVPTHQARVSKRKKREVHERRKLQFTVVSLVTLQSAPFLVTLLYVVIAFYVEDASLSERLSLGKMVNAAGERWAKTHLTMFYMEDGLFEDVEASWSAWYEKDTEKWEYAASAFKDVTHLDYTLTYGNETEGIQAVQDQSTFPNQYSLLFESACLETCTLYPDNSMSEAMDTGLQRGMSLFKEMANLSFSAILENNTESSATLMEQFISLSGGMDQPLVTLAESQISIQVMAEALEQSMTYFREYFEDLVETQIYRGRYILCVYWVLLIIGSFFVFKRYVQVNRKMQDIQFLLVAFPATLFEDYPNLANVILLENEKKT